MTTYRRFRSLTCALLTLTAAAVIACPRGAAAQASFSVSGDSLTLTLSTPIVFVTTAAGTTGESGMGSGIGLVIKGAYSTPPAVNFVTGTASGSMTLTLGSQTFDLPNSLVLRQRRVRRALPA